jgi:phospholipase C
MAREREGHHRLGKGRGSGSGSTGIGSGSTGTTEGTGTGTTVAPGAGGTGLASIEHIVVLMLENRSFDHMLGYLYTDAGNVTPTGHAFDGLTGKETNPDSSGNPVSVFQITPSTPNAYFMPGADPGEGYKATNDQLWGSDTAPASGTAATNQGFIKDYAYTLGWEKTEGWSILSGTTAADIMGCFTPQALPVLSALAKGYAVCDQWFCSAPTETLPNRAFLCAGTSQGHMDDKTKTYTCPSIFGSMTKANVTWKVYGYDAEPLTKQDFPDISNAPASNFGLFTDFQNDAKNGTLPSYVFLEPSWGSSGNSQHPNYDVAKGEQFIHDTYEALRSGPGWNQTLFVLTYDEHGGCYDHVSPPWGATPPDTTAGEFGFGFDRFGVRVPTVLISPLIAEGTVYRVPSGAAPLDHTSVLKTIEQRWNIPALTERDKAAPGFGDVITLTTPRTDDVLSGVTVPASGSAGPAAGTLSHLEAIREELINTYHPGPRVPTSESAHS